MKAKVKELIKNELIGEILELPLMQVKGKIIDETKNCFEILTNDGHRKKILKNQKLILYLGDKKIEINGKTIEIRPEERPKKIK